MLAYGGGSVKRNGIYDEIRSILQNSGKEIVGFSGIMPNPTCKKVQEGVEVVRKNYIDLIIALGGGSVIDCCKVISAHSQLKEDIWTMEYEKGIFPQTGIPIGAIVTVS